MTRAGDPAPAGGGMTDEDVQTSSASFVETPGAVWVAKTDLKPGAVGPTGAVMQNVTHIAPAIAAFFFTQTIFGFPGAHAPLPYLLGFIVVLALGVWGLADPGPGGFTLQSFSYGFNPGNIATSTGFALAIVFTVQGLTGWEAAVPLAEETENPRRNVPRATMASIVIIGLMLVLVIWGQVIGLGVNNLSKLISSPELPALVIAHRVWGTLWFLALIAMFTSVFGASLACQNVATRMWFGMGRSGVLPAAFGRVHPVRKTPTAAVTMQFVLSAVLGLVGGWWLSPDKLFILTLGFVLVIAVIFIYIAPNPWVVRYYWPERRGHFSLILQFCFPVGTKPVLIYSLYKSFSPFPAHPYNWSPFIVGGWLLIGIAILAVLRARGNEQWLTRAGAAISERPETPEELRNRPAAWG